MRKLLFTPALLCITILCSAQNFSLMTSGGRSAVGVELHPGFVMGYLTPVNRIYPMAGIAEDLKTGWHLSGGIMLRLGLSENLGIRTGINFTHFRLKHLVTGMKFSNDYDTVSHEIRPVTLTNRIGLSQVELPLLVEMHLIDNDPYFVSFMVGPVVGINVGSRLLSDYTFEDGTSRPNSPEVSMVPRDLIILAEAMVSFEMRISQQWGFSAEPGLKILITHEDMPVYGTDGGYVVAGCQFVLFRYLK